MGNLSLTVACGPYDRMEAIRTGAVQVEGIDLTYVAIQFPPEIFARKIYGASFDDFETSLAHYLISRAGELSLRRPAGVSVARVPQRVYLHQPEFRDRRVQPDRRLGGTMTTVLETGSGALEGSIG